MTSWRELIAIGSIARDLSVEGIARAAGVHAADAESALRSAHDAGVLRDGVLDQRARIEMVADLPVERVAEVHASTARRLFAAGPDRVLDAVHHARAAGNLVPLAELVDMADRGGRISLSLGDYGNAFELFTLAVEFDPGDDRALRARRLFDLAMAAFGLGRIRDARERLAQVVTIAELDGNPSLAARAAVQYASPAEWYSGDARTIALLQRAEDLDLTTCERALVRAARARVEMRVPTKVVDGQQYGWVVRASVAQPMAEEALEAAAECPDDVRALSLLAWRSTHRAPRHLARRRELSSTALDLVQPLHIPSLQVEIAFRCTVDALESGDRPRADESLAVARWVAMGDRNPLLLWWAHTLAAGIAYLDGEIAEAREQRRFARAVGKPMDLPGWIGAEMFFVGQEVLAGWSSDNVSTLLHDENSNALAHPLGLAIAASVLARSGASDVAKRYVQRALSQAHEEESYLLIGTRCADAATTIGDRTLVDTVIEMLTPWSTHVSVDSSGWWCDGPVSLWLAQLHLAATHRDRAAELLDVGAPVAQALNDVRSLRRVDDLNGRLGPVVAATAHDLTTRELAVLAQMATGATNPQIAASLSYSLSTIRVDTMSIYRKLGVTGRAEAVALAVKLGLHET